MRLFFKSKKFLIIALIALVLAVTLTVCGITGVFSAPQSNFLSSVLRPVQNAASAVSGSVGSFFDNMKSNAESSERIKELENELARKDEKLKDYENAMRQNEFYKEFLNIKEEHPDFSFTSAMIIAKDTSDPFFTFTIDKGTLDGVSVFDPVITSAGVVGYIRDAYSTQSVVMTVLNPSINISASDNRTRDTGNICGSMEYAQKGMTLMQYVRSTNTIASGDYVVTSGTGGVFPAGLIIGTVDEVKTGKNTVSCYATIKPIQDLSHISDVMVVTDFSGKAK
ncbi:MAG: rod shape-determining protein MreC [Acutalibacteraceae bacterium]